MGGISLPKIKIPKFNLSFSKGQLAIIGLDIGSHAVKMCQVAKKGSGYQLLSLGSAVVPVGAVENGILQEPESVIRVITSLLKNLGIKEKRAAISISGYSVIVKKINLGVMDEDELEEYLQTEVGQYIPFDIDDVYIDYQDLKTNTEEYDRTDIMLVAAKKDVVDGYVTMLKSAGLDAILVDVDGFALENAYEANFSLKENIALVDIGATKMSINVVSRGASVLARDVVIGSRQLTEQIQNQFSLDIEEAEALKIGTVPAEEKQQVLEEIFVNTCTQWALEIKKAIDLFYSNNPEATLNKLILSGGGSRVNGLDRFLHDETGIATEVFNPFTRFAADQKRIDPGYLKYIAPEMAISVGLAVRPPEL